MSKRLTLDLFIQRAKEIHGDKYDYSKVNYINSYTKVCIICPIHGTFEQDPHTHLKGCGCSKCGKEKQKTLICGVGTNDSDTKGKSYTVWRSMIQRCYSNSCNSKFPTYIDCTVCDEWLTFSNFKKWFDKNYKNGYDLDKDILIKGNKVYSPQTCVFIPHRINTLLINCKLSRGELPIGVCSYGDMFQVKIRLNGKKKHIGYFATKEDAFIAYKKIKEEYIKDIALEYYHNGLIDYPVYCSLMNWKIDIND